MKTWINKKTGNRYPEKGYFASFWIKTNKHGEEILDVFLRGVHGWKKDKFSNWTQEEIPDLVTEPFSLTTFREYAKAYGYFCAADSLPCCDAIKPTWTQLYLDPNYPDEATCKWFEETFKATVLQMSQWTIACISGQYLFDIRGFEKHLAKEFGYVPDIDMSMGDFLVQKFGKENYDKFKEHFIKAKKVENKS